MASLLSSDWTMAGMMMPAIMQTRNQRMVLLSFLSLVEKASRYLYHQ